VFELSLADWARFFLLLVPGELGWMKAHSFYWNFEAHELFFKGYPINQWFIKSLQLAVSFSGQAFYDTNFCLNGFKMATMICKLHVVCKKWPVLQSQPLLNVKIFANPQNFALWD
jgi:hypothetical protein